MVRMNPHTVTNTDVNSMLVAVYKMSHGTSCLDLCRTYGDNCFMQPGKKLRGGFDLTVCHSMKGMLMWQDWVCTMYYIE